MKSISILSKGKKNSKQNIQNTKSVESKLQFKYSYSIIPSNFVNLSEENQAQKMGQFFDILRVIEDRIKITMSRRMVPITCRRPNSGHASHAGTYGIASTVK